MSTVQTYSSGAALSRRRQGALDVIVLLAFLALLWGGAELTQAAAAPFNAASAPSTVSTDPANLPYYAARSMLRMFIALGLSVVFAICYATAAARSRRARVVLLPLLDVLQSVPILGFLSVTVTGFMALFPGSEWGLECASIFAIFTSQAWNMTFSLYQSMTSQSRDLDESARALRLSKWQRLWRVDLPNGVIPLVWNGMMSFGGGWFFLVASESITVDGRTYALPGIGSYVAAAIAQANLADVLAAMAVMVAMVVGVNVLFWRPLVAWAERFRVEDSTASQAPKSIVLTALRRSRLPRLLGRVLRPLGEGSDRIMRVFGTADRTPASASRRAGDVVFAVIVGVALATGVAWVVTEIAATTGFAEVGYAIGLAFVTFGRVLVVLVIATVLWVPVGVWIGMNPRICRIAQPIVQVLASFPANFLFPIVTVVLVATSISLNWGGIVLMALGSQWYILFNVIAGASAIPSDLREAAADLGLPRRQRWTKLILPAVLPSYITGAITAAGGAWNASIVAEVVTYGSTTLVATGLGSYISQASATGDQARLLIGVGVMSVFVVGLNRVVWRPLQNLAERRFAA